MKSGLARHFFRCCKITTSLSGSGCVAAVAVVRIGGGRVDSGSGSGKRGLGVVVEVVTCLFSARDTQSSHVPPASSHDETSRPVAGAVRGGQRDDVTAADADDDDDGGGDALASVLLVPAMTVLAVSGGAGAGSGRGGCGFSTSRSCSSARTPARSPMPSIHALAAR